MLLNYLKLSLRLLVRNPFFTLINVLGLSVGFASFFILWQYSSSELKADQYHKDFERIARLCLYWRFPDQGGERGNLGLLTFGGIRPHQGPSIAQDFPQVEQSVRLLMQPEFEWELVGHGNRVVVSVSREAGGRELFEETRMVYADSNLFSFFSIPLVHGEKSAVLKNAHSVVLSEHTARKYFDTKNPIGELIQVNDSILLLVTGVFEDLPHNTHLAFDLVVSMTGIDVNQWPYKMMNTYVKVYRHTVLEDFVSEINKNSAKYWAAEISRFPRVQPEIFFQPLKDIAFSAPYERDYLVPKTKSALVLMQFASLLILIMAWINYNNLAASRMMKRMKEIATRKMTGALSSDFAKQFVIESCLIYVLAVAVAFTLMQLVRVPFNELFRIDVTEVSSLSHETWLVFVAAILSGILISGFYPTRIAATHDPRTLFSLSKKGGSKRWVQSLLSTSQYVMALVLMLWVYIVYLQLNFILNKDLGIQRDQVLIIDSPIVKSDAYINEFEGFLQELRRLNGVVEATYSETIIGDIDLFVWLKGPAQDGFGTVSSNGGVDESFIPFYHIPVLAGRNFVANDKPDVAILSPQATRRIGFARPEDALGEKISIDELQPQQIQIVGIIDDYRVRPLFNLASTATELKDGFGICLLYKNGVHPWDVPERISIKIETEKLDVTMVQVGDLYRKTFGRSFFNWYFLDDHVNKAYDNDRTARNQIALFTGIAIGLSCLGLLGMMSTIAEEKIKEIGIRKVLGAGAKQIAQRLISSVFLPVIPAIAIAVPVAYYLANQFLDRYLEKISLQWWHFAIPVLILFTLLLGTIASLLFKAVNGNPVDALKYE